MEEIWLLARMRDRRRVAEEIGENPKVQSQPLVVQPRSLSPQDRNSQSGRLATVVKALSLMFRQSYPPWNAPRFSMAAIPRPMIVPSRARANVGHDGLRRTE